MPASLPKACRRWNWISDRHCQTNKLHLRFLKCALKCTAQLAKILRRSNYREPLRPYRNMYLQMNSIASTYISGVILSLWPQARLMTT